MGISIIFMACIAISIKITIAAIIVILLSTLTIILFFVPIQQAILRCVIVYCHPSMQRGRERGRS